MRTLYLDVEESKLKDLELGQTVDVRVTGKVRGMRAKPERPKGSKESDCCEPFEDDYYKYASLDMNVSKIELLGDNEFATLDAAMDEETDVTGFEPEVTRWDGPRKPIGNAVGSISPSSTSESISTRIRFDLLGNLPATTSF